MDKPTVAGYYWVKRKKDVPWSNQGTDWQVVLFAYEGDYSYVYEVGSDRDEVPDAYEGWTGPLEPPKTGGTNIEKVSIFS